MKQKSHCMHSEKLAARQKLILPESKAELSSSRRGKAYGEFIETAPLPA